MTILYPTPAPVKPDPPSAAASWLPVPPTRAPYTASDVAWLAAEDARIEDARYDRMAEEAAFMDRYERGLSC